LVKKVEDMLIRKITKKPILTILYALNEGPKRWSELEKLINKRYVHEGIRELLNLGLVEVELVFDTPTGSKAYQLSPLGKKVVQLLEQIEKEFEKYHSQLPKEPEKFVDELLEGD